MFTDRNILFWCLDPVIEPFQFINKEWIINCKYFIPVYCFDDRINSIMDVVIEKEQDHMNTFKKVEDLRLKFRSMGSDLLIVNGVYEKIIPSLARVLQTNEVVTINNAENQHSDIYPGVQKFCLDKIKQTGDLLSRHSIDFKVIKPVNQQVYHIPELTFPPFPEIETGTVPHGHHI